MKNPAVPVAKAKRRATENAADEEAIAAFDKAVAENVVRSSTPTKKRHEVPTGEVVQIMADEIELLYHEMGARIDRPNAEDKALTIFRNVSIYHEAVAVEKEIPHSLCEEHSHAPE